MIFLIKHATIASIVAGMAIVTVWFIWPLKASTQTPPALTPTPIGSSVTPGPTSVATVGPSATPSATVQAAAFATITIPDSILQTPVGYRGVPGVNTFAQHFKQLTVFADGEKCTLISLTDSSSRTNNGKLISIGLPNQPAACKRNGAKLTFLDGNGIELASEFTLQAGAALQLTNFGPKPISSGADTSVRPPQTGSGGSPLRASKKDNPGVRIAAGAALGGVLGLSIASGFVLARKHMQHRN